MKEKKKAILMMVTYNRLDLTKKTLDFLVTNTGYDFDLVIVDNGSDDGTPEYLSNFRDLNNPEETYLKNMHLIFLEKNKGIAIGRNIALKKADDLKAEWYCTIDNDVKMPDNWLKDSIDILKINNNFGVIGVNMEDVKYPIIKKNGFEFQEKPKGNLGTACMVFRKPVHQMVGFFNTEYGKYGEEDADFGMRIRVLGFKMGYVKEMGEHLGSDEKDDNEYRKFKTKQHADNLDLFKVNCGKYVRKEKALYIPYVEG